MSSLLKSESGTWCESCRAAAYNAKRSGRAGSVGVTWETSRKEAGAGDTDSLTSEVGAACVNFPVVSAAEDDTDETAR